MNHPKRYSLMAFGKGKKNPNYGGANLRGEKNPFFGKKHTFESRQKISQNHVDVSGKKNPRWKGELAGVTPLHLYMRKQLPKPEKCPTCNQAKRLELCNISHSYNPQTYNRELKNWKWMCYKCHRYYDFTAEERSNITKKGWKKRKS